MQINEGSFRRQIVEKITLKQNELDAWFFEQIAKTPVLPYTSIDLRDSGFKVAPVDSNAFPAGFNNICSQDWGVAANGFKKILKVKDQSPKRILIIPENHSSNLQYFDNLHVLKHILTLAGFAVTIGHINPTLKANLPGECTEVTSAMGEKVILERIFRDGDLLQTMQTKFTEDDLILLNNDLSNGVPTELKNLKQTIVPHPLMGWYHRKKSKHLQHYWDLAGEVAEILNIDPWLIRPHFGNVDQVDFMSGAGIETLAEHVEILLNKIRKDYQAHKISSEPFVFIKHNAGTYGRSIMTVKNAEEVINMNRRSKNKMHISKGGVQVSSVVLMEGIPTDLKESGQTAEPVIYLTGTEPIGGFLRINPNRDAEGNLNSPGAYFKTLCFANLFRNTSLDAVVLEKIYGTLGRLSALANGREMQ